MADTPEQGEWAQPAPPVQQAQQAVLVAAPAFIDGDVPCFFCGYNLRSLGRDAVCPECGNSIRESFRSGWLGYADPAWLRKLRTGITIPLWTILALVVFYFAIIGWVMFSVMSNIAAGPPQPPDMTELQTFGVIATLGFGVATLISVWLLTSPEPVPDQSPRRSTLAKWIRVLYVGALGIGLLAAIMSTVVFYGEDPAELFAGGPSTAAFATHFGISILGGCAYLLAFVLLLIHLRRIARRNFKKGLAKLMTVLIWGSVTMVGLWAMFVVGAILTARSMAASLPMAATGPALWPPAASAPSSTAAGSTGGSPGTGTVNSSGGSYSYSVRVTGSPYGATSTMPGGAAFAPTTMPVGSPPFPFRGGFPLFFLGVCLTELSFFAWFVCIIVALFWFRVTLSRAIRDNAFNMLPAG